jgi:hypothetical protein
MVLCAFLISLPPFPKFEAWKVLHLPWSNSRIWKELIPFSSFWAIPICRNHEYSQITEEREIFHSPWRMKYSITELKVELERVYGKKRHEVELMRRTMEAGKRKS